MVAPEKRPRPLPFFVGDHLALDFLNSSAATRGGRIEWLGNGTDLVDWLEAAGAIDATVATRFRRTGRESRKLDAVAGQARCLREWTRRFVARHAGMVLAADALDELGPLNRLLARGAIYRQIEVADGAARDGSGGPQVLDWRQKRRWTTPQQMLMPVAEAIGNLLCHADFRLVRTCKNPNCTFVFYDRTKSHARRWCSMAVCGNRAKAAAHRARSRARGAPAAR